MVLCVRNMKTFYLLLLNLSIHSLLYFPPYSSFWFPICGNMTQYVCQVYHQLRRFYLTCFAHAEESGLQCEEQFLLFKVLELTHRSLFGFYVMFCYHGYCENIWRLHIMWYQFLVAYYMQKAALPLISLVKMISYDFHIQPSLAFIFK